jgi:hypothetical protein
VTQLVEALRYKPEDRGFDSRWCQRNFFLGTMALVLIQLLTEMRPVRRADNLTTFMCRLSRDLKPQPQPQGPVQTCNGLAYQFEKILEQLNDFVLSRRICHVIQPPNYVSTCGN